MIGAEPPQLQHTRGPTRARWCSTVQGLSLPQSRTSSALSCTTSRFDVRAGEIVGIAGVSGNGQQELMAALSGEDRARAARLDPPVRQRRRSAPPRTRRKRRPALRARRAPGPRRGADAVAGAKHAAHAHRERSAARGWITLAPVQRAGRSIDQRASTSRPAAPARRRK